MEISGKSALVTGGAMGMGKGYCLALLKKGAKVAFVDINEKEGMKTLSELQAEYGEDKVRYYQCDIANGERFAEVYKQAIVDFGSIDIMVNNAGIVCEHKWEECIRVNFIGMAKGTVLAMEHMRTDNGGRGGLIINISSTVAFGPFKFYPTYCATKHAILAYTRSWNEYSEHAHLGVSVLCLCPDGTDTTMLNVAEGATFNNAWIEDYLAENPILSVEDMVVGFLKLIEDKDRKSGVMCVTWREGPTYRTF